MTDYIGGLQDKVKASSSTVALWGAKILTGAFIGLTFSLIGEELIDYGWISFFLVVVAIAAALLKIMRPWTWLHVFIFNLICVLIGLLLRMYILIAPG
jgi:hypothetical protein